MIKCFHCQNEYEEIFETQGLGCASTVTNYGIQGYYGSRVADGNSYKWNGPMPDHIWNKLSFEQENIICDMCITFLLASDEIVLTEEGIYF